MKLFFLVILALCQTAIAEVIDVTQIASKSQKDVQAYLGEPTHCESSKYGPKCYYDKGETEIVFIRNKADWITVEALDDKPFDASILTELGLIPQQPTHQTKHVLRWQHRPEGYLSVSVFPGQTNTDYAYIKVTTP